MTAISTNFGEGGANLAPDGAGEPTLADTLRDVADDLAAQQPAEAVASDATDLASALLLVNELKGIINAMEPGTYTILTTKA